MTRTGNLAVFAAIRVSVLATAILWTTVAAAQSLPTMSRGDNTWQSRPPIERDNPFQGDGSAAANDSLSASGAAMNSSTPYGGAAWQPAESANAVPRPAVAPPHPNAAAAPAKPTRWLAPNNSLQRTVGNASPATGTNLAAQQTKDDQHNARGTTAYEPEQFVPPANAARLSEVAPRGNTESAARNTTSTSAAVSSVDRPANQTIRPSVGQRVALSSTANKSAVQLAPKRISSTAGASMNDSAARASVSPPQRGPSEREELTAAPAPPIARNSTNRPQPGSAGQSRFFDDAGWIHPLRQVAYMAGGPMTSDPSEMDLPSPKMSTMPPQNMSNMSGDGQWIGGSPGGPCCDSSCGPSCPCDGSCSCDGGPMCGDCCDPSCGEPCCGAPSGPGRTDDLICVGWGDDESCHTIRVRVPKFQEVMVLGGVHGFKGPFDQGRDHGNFGFQEGINIGAKMPFLDWGYQFGYVATQSELNGDTNTGVDHSFMQSFVTAGVFHRTPNGLQGGLAWDWMHDERNGGDDFAQIRGELSLVNCGCHECGLMGSIHLNENKFDTIGTNEQTIHHSFQATNQYLLFYRMHGCRGGEGRVFGGLDDDSDGIVGADFLLPLQCCWSLQSEFTYLIPDNGGGTLGSQQEAWNLGISLVWHWKNHARECHSNPYRPLFNVADNGSLIVDDRP